MNVTDMNGDPAVAEVLTGPMILNTPEGEFCAEAGQVLVQYLDKKPMVLTPDQFAAQFYGA